MRSPETLFQGDAWYTIPLWISDHESTIGASENLWVSDYSTKVSHWEHARGILEWGGRGKGVVVWGEGVRAKDSEVGGEVQEAVGESERSRHRMIANDEHTMEREARYRRQVNRDSLVLLSGL